MKSETMQLAVEYYTLVGEKKSEEYKQYLHPDVEFSSPMATLKGKEAVYNQTLGFTKVLNALKIRESFGHEDKAVVVYDTDISGVDQSVPSVSLLTFKDGKIVTIELFFDGTPFNG